MCQITFQKLKSTEFEHTGLLHLTTLAIDFADIVEFDLRRRYVTIKAVQALIVIKINVIFN